MTERQRGERERETEGREQILRGMEREREEEERMGERVEVP